ncbi:VQ motif-containing protein 11-like [Impatiens glandulifera]|uniref:VQ motif-containing protein 11-like n=1 Tax=Impatiens glandulifera TaxID=253017 RepID=UPI001FB06957|nr:VQ motif-containing protein 11-like [Impatiens glandulifera]
MKNSNTIFIQTDPSNFRAIVQHLTGKPTTAVAGAVEIAPPMPPLIRLHNRRQTNNLEIKLGSGIPMNRANAMMGFSGEKTVMVSPVSPFDLFGLPSPAPEEEEQRAIAEKGFYLHPSPLSMNRSSKPELLNLFPLHSTRHHDPSSS